MLMNCTFVLMITYHSIWVYVGSVTRVALSCVDKDVSMSACISVCNQNVRIFICTSSCVKYASKKAQFCWCLYMSFETLYYNKNSIEALQIHGKTCCAIFESLAFSISSDVGQWNEGILSLPPSQSEKFIPKPCFVWRLQRRRNSAIQ